MKRVFAMIFCIVMVTPAWALYRVPTNRATIVVVGPCVDCTDGVTPETAMTVPDITCELYKMSDAGTLPTRTEITLAASGTNNDMVHITNDVGGYWAVELTAAQLNFVGRARLCFTDADVMCPVWEDLIVEPNNVYDSGVSGTDNLEVDLVADQSAVTIGTVSTLTGHTAQTGDSYARIGAPVGDSISADIAAVSTSTWTDATIPANPPRNSPGWWIKRIYKAMAGLD